jgi:hypothetical protein
MAKRRATVSLRKPSPAPEVEAPVTPAPAVEETPVSAVAVAMVSPVMASPVTLASSEPEPVTAMPSAPVTPAAPEVMSIEAFVSGAAAALERAVGDVPQAKLMELLERGPEGYRELTVYLPEQLARDLSLHCMDRNLDMNRLVASALVRHLDALPTKLDKRRIAAIARALLVHLAQRARGILLSRRGWKTTAVAPAAAVG